MNRLTHLLVITLLLCIPALTYAQDDNDDEKENPSKYLVGAVPEKDGKVVFSQEMLLPGLSKDQVYDQMLSWMEKRLKKNKNKSRVVYADKSKGMIAGIVGVVGVVAPTGFKSSVGICS